jgi:DNA-binding MarR family transcriptional regulator
MTTAPAAFARFGYTLAFAERTLTALLRAHLAERGIEPETWYALQLIAMHGPALDRQALTDELSGSPTLTADSTSELLARLEAEGLIRGGRQVELTPEGQALHRSLSEYVAVPRVRLLSQFNPDDVETTVRTLQAIAERAAAEAPSAATGAPSAGTGAPPAGADAPSAGASTSSAGAGTSSAGAGIVAS